MKQIIEGLKYIHSKKIIHRDIKLANILIHFKNVSKKAKSEKININDIEENDILHSEIKIIDFGLSTKLGPDGLAKSMIGTPFNMPPKIILNKFKKAGGYEKLRGYNEKADIWSLGTICYEMLTGKPIFNVDNYGDLLEEVEKGHYSFPINTELSTEIISFLNKMLQFNGELRASAEELSHHEFLNKNVNQFTKFHFEKNTNYFTSPIKYLTGTETRDKNELYKKQYVELLFKDYQAAREYFKNNQLPEQERDAYNKCLHLQNIIKEINLGKKINLKSLPKELEQEYIYGCSTIERNKKFKELLSYYRGIKNDIEVKIKLFEQQCLNKGTQEEYQRNKKKFGQLKYIIEDFSKMLKNAWVPVPKYKKELQRNIVQKISYDKSEFKIKILIKKIDGKGNDVKLKITLLINETKKLKQKIELKPPYFCQEWIWSLTAEDWMNFDNNNYNFLLGVELEKDFESEYNKGINLDISKIKKGKGMIFEQNLPSVNNDKISIDISTLLPEGEKNNIIETKEVINILKIYPPFEWKSLGKHNYDKPSFGEVRFIHPK